jgi:hypothetical protein
MVTPATMSKGFNWTASLFVLAAALLFGGVAGNWFSTSLVQESFLLRSLQLSAGALIMGSAVSVLGSLIFGRHPIRWGIGMPFLVYVGGTLLALVSGRDGAVSLLLGAPLFLGLSFAAGVMSAFLIEGTSSEGRRS